MSHQVAQTVRGMIDQTITKMGPVRQRVARRVMAKHSAAIIDHVALKMFDDPECVCDQEVMFTLNSEAFTGDTVMAFNPDNLIKILDWLMKNLPAIIALFFGK